jgi:hypothetical protein
LEFQYCPIYLINMNRTMRMKLSVVLLLCSLCQITYARLGQSEAASPFTQFPVLQDASIGRTPEEEERLLRKTRTLYDASRQGDNADKKSAGNIFQSDTVRVMVGFKNEAGRLKAQTDSDAVLSTMKHSRVVTVSLPRSKLQQLQEDRDIE